MKLSSRAKARSFVLAKQAAKNIAELEDHAASRVGIHANQRGDRIQRVEQKCGLIWLESASMRALKQQLLVALEIHLNAGVVPDFMGAATDMSVASTTRQSFQFHCGLARRASGAWWRMTSATRPSSRADASQQRQHFPHHFGVVDHAHERLWGC